MYKTLYNILIISLKNVKAGIVCFTCFYCYIMQLNYGIKIL